MNNRQCVYRNRTESTNNDTAEHRGCNDKIYAVLCMQYPDVHMKIVQQQIEIEKDGVCSVCYVVL